MLITNPHNPLGTTVSRSTLRGYCDFAQKYDLHLVSDEIYAMSVYENKGTQLASEQDFPNMSDHS